jgi:CHAT domain-containing protein
MIHSCAGHWGEATTCFEQFHTLCEQHNDRFHSAFALQSLADAYQQSDPAHWPLAQQLYTQARAIFREFQDPYNEFSTWAHQGVLHQKQGAAAEALACYERSLAMVEQVRRGISSAEVRSDFFATVVHIYANAFLVQAASGQWAAAFDTTERARSRAFLDSLIEADFSLHVEATPLRTAAVQAHLAEDALLLAYFTTGLFTSHGGQMTARQAAQNVLFPPPKSFLLAITRTEIALFDLGLDPNALVPQVQNQWVEAYFLTPQVRRALYQKLVEPCAALLSGKRRIYLIPHGPLHSVPLHALLAADGESWLRTTGPTFVYAPSASILLRPRHQAKGQLLAPGLAIGYNGQGATRLRFAEEEARRIAQLVHGQTLLGSAASLDALHRQAGSQRILHFACHGEFDADAPLLSKLYIGPEAVLTGQTILETLRLQCELVTLSACEGALSQVRRGDELYGLVRAFLYAGAQALIASLWRVNDSATLLLMDSFYRDLAAGVAVAEALKKAQLYVRTLTRRQVMARVQHLFAEETITDFGLPPGSEEELPFAAPQHWAAFILVGEPVLTPAPFQSPTADGAA